MAQGVKKKKTLIRMFQCPECGEIVYASKRKRMTGVGHIKTMWRWKCKAETDHVQIGFR